MYIEEANLFKGLHSQFMEEVRKHLVEEIHDAGTFLFRHGDPADYLYILVEGRVRLSIGEKGHIALVVSRPGDAFGWSSLLEKHVYTASAECLDPCRVTRIKREKLMELFERNPATGLQFYRRLAELITHRLLDTYRMMPAAHGEQRAAPGG